MRGLTTAANICAVAAIGLAAGGALDLAAIAATALMLVLLTLIKPMEPCGTAHRPTGERSR